MCRSGLARSGAARFTRLGKISPFTIDLGFLKFRRRVITPSSDSIGRELRRGGGTTSSSRPSNSLLIALKWSASRSAASMSDLLGKSSLTSKIGGFSLQLKNLTFRKKALEASGAVRTCF